MLLDWWFGGCCSYLGGLGDDVGETLGDGTGEDLLGGTGGGKSLFGIVGESLDWNKRCAQINYIRMDKMNSFYLHQNQNQFCFIKNFWWMSYIKYTINIKNLK